MYPALLYIFSIFIVKKAEKWYYNSMKNLVKIWILKIILEVFLKMIRVIKIDGTEILINSNLIETLTPGETGSVIKLITGEEILIKNTQGDIVQKIEAYRKGLTEARRQEEKKKAEYKEKET